VCNARSLGNSELIISGACLGTMTFGIQNNCDDAFRQLDYARSVGVNFIDTAELYPVPTFAKNWRAGATEEIVGKYLDNIGESERDKLVIATKIVGYFPKSLVAAARRKDRGDKLPDCRLDEASVKEACHASLKRLRTDRVDLMQIHWPDRYIPSFGQMQFDHGQIRDDAIPIEETASALRDLIDEGKIRYIGISNESTLGVCEWVKATEKLGIRDKLVSIQNSYSLLDRRFDSELAEACSYYGIGLLPWSVLAGGLLSGKYQTTNVDDDNAGDDAGDDDSRRYIRASSKSRFYAFPTYMSRWSPSSASQYTLDAVDEYANIAHEAGMTPAELAIAFVRTRRFVSDNGSVIIGATTMEQLKENLKPFLEENPDGEELKFLDDDILEAIDSVHMKCRDPSCKL